MRLFQQSVFKNRLKNWNKERAKEAFRLYKREFLPKIENIKKSKEEQYQYGFFDDLFVKVLGYTLYPTPDYNLTTEFKNKTDRKKADGAILRDGKVVGVVELKSTKTKSMESIINQAFNYRNSHSGCRYVIISNFEKLRFYIDYSDRFIEFNLFTINEDEFIKLYYILSWKSIRDDVPLKLKEISKIEEENISKELYKKYAFLRENLFKNIVKNNPEIDKLTALSKTQTLLDRLIFIFFGEDRGILPANTIKSIIERYKNDIEERELYHFYKIFFRAISRGNRRLKIPAYNGGLFESDDVLEGLKIDDCVLETLPQELSRYNFNSDIDVNILGHIFEQSISDLEELRAKIQNEKFDFKSSKRKKDGVFYTPEYITKYIVDKTVGEICKAKKEELELNNLEIKIPKNPKKLNKKEKNIEKKLVKYREFLLKLKILDPACGSGAFLNQTLNFLLKEHQFINDGIKTLMGGNVLGILDVKKSVLENNLYGVDINSEAVEIAKLSLWLRTVENGRKLDSLADKIKVGNSLIDDKSVAKDAFVWKDEFPEVFENGGFDVVIGNPPYVRLQGIKSSYEEESLFYEKTYKSAVGNYDIYVLFMERGFNLLKKDGKLSYILPHKFLISEFGKGIREFLTDNRAMESIIHFGSEMVFEDASTYTCIITLSNSNQELKFAYLHPKEIIEAHKIDWDKIPYEELGAKKWNLSNKNIKNVLEKIDKQPLRVKDIFSRIFTGLQTSADNIYLLEIKNNGLYSKSLDKIVEVENGLLKPILKGDDIHRYSKLKNRYFVIFPYLINNGKAEPMSEEFIRENFPKGYEYLKENEKALRAREKGRFNNEKEWFLFSRKQGIDGVEQPKIITPDIAYKSQMSFDNGKYYHGTTLYSFIKKDEIRLDYKYFLTIFNSSLMWFFIKNISSELRGGYFRYKTKYLQNFPLPKISEDEQKPFIEKADIMLDLNKKLQEIKDKFLDELEVEKIPKKLQSFEDLDFNEFIKEFKKAKKLKFKNRLEERKFKDEWRDLFEQDRKNALEIKEKINKTDREIDLMVYELYGLSDDEIEIVENR